MKYGRSEPDVGVPGAVPKSMPSRHRDRDGPVASREIAPEGRARIGRIDDHRVGKTRHSIHAAVMAFGLLPADVFRKLDGDQVVDENHETRIRTFFEPGNDSRPMQVMMRDQQVNETASVRVQLGVKGPLAPEKNMTPQHPGNCAGPIFQFPVKIAPGPELIE